MRTKTIDLYQFDELSYEAQQKALQDHYDINVDYEWWDSCYECAGEAAKMLGIAGFRIRGFDIDRGSFVQYEGSYRYVTGAAAAIAKEWPTDTELRRIAAALQDAQRRCFYSASAVVSPAYRTSLSVDVEGTDNDLDDSVVEDIEQALKDFADWVLTMLRDGYEYLASEEAIRESLISNEYEFTEDGGRA